ncbi:hypothetical protein AB4Y45_25535 [Paraburkholderia sp. EG287A]|uniref:hypothetical protein n=1 Tax=Paraburkholderia sp. EG287A TaxID=3237012 RepID=UPI0034D17C61
MRHHEGNALARAGLKVNGYGFDFRVGNAARIDTARALTPCRVDVSPDGCDTLHRFDARASNIGAAARVRVLCFLCEPETRERILDEVNGTHLVARVLGSRHVNDPQFEHLASLIRTRRCRVNHFALLRRQLGITKIIHVFSPLRAEKRKST